MKSSSNDSLLTQISTHQQQKYYDTPNGSTNGFIINNYAINSSNVVTRCLCYMMKGVQRNIQKCVAALVLISFFSIIFFTQYMDSPALVGWVEIIGKSFDCAFCDAFHPQTTIWWCEKCWCGGGGNCLEGELKKCIGDWRLRRSFKGSSASFCSEPTKPKDNCLLIEAFLTKRFGYFLCLSFGSIYFWNCRDSWIKKLGIVS